ncbi:MAG: prenyltransferase [Chlamydiota bacterium]
MARATFFIRALRLPFTIHSALPFIFGSLLALPGEFKGMIFAIGLGVVIATHLAANLINDYVDSRSGIDWVDPHFYKFFGGSQLIQEGFFSEKFYLYLSLLLSFLALAGVVVIAFMLNNFWIAAFYLAILAAAWMYSTAPLSLTYHGMGEVVVFILFGPAPVMIGYYLQAGDLDFTRLCP